MFELYKGVEAKEIYRKLFTYMFLAISLATFILSVLIKDVLKCVATPPFFEAYKVVPLLAVGYLFKANFIFFMTGFYTERKTKYLPILSGFVLCTNLLFNFILVSRLGIIGAAIATMLSFGCGSIFAYVVSQKLYRIDYEFGRCLKVLGVGIVLYWISNIFTPANLFFSVIIKILIILSFPFALHITCFFTKEEKIKLREIILGGINRRWMTLYKRWEA
jgi:O-antigen/teichoic acid export membrane protein